MNVVQMERPQNKYNILMDNFLKIRKNIFIFIKSLNQEYIIYRLK